MSEPHTVAFVKGGKRKRLSKVSPSAFVLFDSSRASRRVTLVIKASGAVMEPVRAHSDLNLPSIYLTAQL